LFGYDNSVLGVILDLYIYVRCLLYTDDMLLISLKFWHCISLNAHTDLHYVFMLRRLNIYFLLRHTDRSVLRSVLWSSLRLNCSDWVLLSICSGQSKTDIVRRIHDDC